MHPIPRPSTLRPFRTLTLAALALTAAFAALAPAALAGPDAPGDRQVTHPTRLPAVFPPGYWRLQGDEVPDWDPIAPRPRADVVQWAPVGPRPITSELFSGDTDASGPVNSIVTDPTDPLTVYIASTAGGVWKTIDGGVTWNSLTDELPSLQHGAIDLCEFSPDIIVMGTGNYVSGTAGSGAFISEDGGDSWRRIGNTTEVGSTCSAIAIHPIDPDIIHITSGSGYRHTINGGASWISGSSGLPTGSCSALLVDPIDPQVIYVARRSDGIYRSADGGVSMTKLAGLPASGFNRIVMGQSPADPATIYAAFFNDAGTTSQLKGLYRTTSSGSGWTPLPAPDFTCGRLYTTFITVDPTDAQTLYCGGVYPFSVGFYGLIRSTDGGATWSDITATSAQGAIVHPFQYALAIGPDGTIWVGSGGGVFKSDDGAASWTSCNADLQVSLHFHTSFQGIRALSGTPGCGTVTKLDSSLAWPQATFGDGGYSVFPTSGPVYSTELYLDILRYNLHVGAPITDIAGPWLNPVTHLPNEATDLIAPFLGTGSGGGATLLGGTYRIWKSTDPTASPPTWTNISDAKFDSGDPLVSLAAALPAGNTIYAGSQAGKVYVTTAGGAPWQIRTEGLPAAIASGLAISPSAPNTAYVGFFAASGPRIFKTINAGATWVNITGNLPVGARVTALAVDDSPQMLFAGTGSGVYTSSDDGATWIKDGTTLPNVNIGFLSVDRSVSPHIVTASTLGRGVYRANTDGSSGTCEPKPRITQQPQSAALCLGDPVTLTVEADDAATFQWAKDDVDIPDATSAALVILSFTPDDAGAYTCLVGNDCGAVRSRAATLELAHLTAVDQPDDVSICEGEPVVTFTFVVDSNPAPSYQWRKGLAPIAGATSATLSLFAPGPGDAGAYSCEVTNGCTTIFSNGAVLSIKTGPSIVTQPQPLAIAAGAPADFTVEATGAPDLSYQWYKDDQAILGAVFDTYHIDSATSDDLGLYTVHIANDCGAITSDPAALTFGCPADLNQDGLVDFGDYLEFLNFFDALDLAVDFNGDGIVDFGDYLEFLNHFDAGC